MVTPNSRRTMTSYEMSSTLARVSEPPTQTPMRDSRAAQARARPSHEGLDTSVMVVLRERGAPQGVPGARRLQRTLGGITWTR